MKPYRLILFYGSSSGAGKSSLSSLLTQQLTAQNQPAIWLYEDDVEHLTFFEPVLQHMRGENELTMPEACLVATAKLVEAYRIANDSAVHPVIIADSILPYYDWLFAADYTYSEVEAFSRKLQELLRPLHPLVVYLQADVATVLQRAVKQRGEAWLHELITFMNSWNANLRQPICAIEDVITYLRRTDNWKVQLLTQWSGDVLWLDSATNSLEACAALMLNQLGLATIIHQPVRPDALISRYTGLYVAEDVDPPDGAEAVAITLCEGELWTTLYWPNGCRLIAEAEHCFRLQDTSHTIVFVANSVGTTGETSKQLRYQYGDRIYRYRSSDVAYEHD